MAHAQTGPVVVSRQAKPSDLGAQFTIEWATSVRVDRKGTLHVYGSDRQHVVFHDGDWTAYIAKAPERERRSWTDYA